MSDAIVQVFQTVRHLRRKYSSVDLRMSGVRKYSGVEFYCPEKRIGSTFR